MRYGRRFHNSGADVGTLGTADQRARLGGCTGAGWAASAVRLIMGECPGL